MRNHKLIRLFTNSPLQLGASITLEGNQLHYVKNVMRKHISDHVVVFNGKDGQWTAEITSLEKKEGIITPLEQTRQQEEEPDIWLVFAPLKGKMDQLAQKATELGVSKLVPVITERTIVDKIKEEKLLVNAIEAAEQCERLTVPEISDVQKLGALLDQWPEQRNILLCDESGGGTPAREALSNVEKDKPWAVFIGPEGGFSKDELAKLHNLPYVTAIGMGPRIMRADTAAIAALTLWQEHLGDWQKMPAFRG